MLVIQQNCRKGYEYIISTLEAGLGLNAGIVCIQEPFLDKKNLAHAGFSLYWPVKSYDRRENHVFIAVRKDLLNKTIIKNQTDLVSHPYGMILDITKGQIHIKEQKRKTWIVNIYDNKIGRKQT